MTCMEQGRPSVSWAAGSSKAKPLETHHVGQLRPLWPAPNSPGGFCCAKPRPARAGADWRCPEMCLCHTPAQCPGWLRARGLGNKEDKEVTLGTQPLQGAPLCSRTPPKAQVSPSWLCSPFLLSWALASSPGRAGREAPLPRGAASQLEKAEAWQAHSVASVGAARLMIFSWRQQWPGVSQPACLASFCVVNTVGRCGDRGWGGVGRSPSQALKESQVGQPSPMLALVRSLTRNPWMRGPAQHPQGPGTYGGGSRFHPGGIR